MENTLTIHDLQRFYDTIKCVLYVHPDDLEQPLVKECKDCGYEIISREIMIKGKAFIQNTSTAGVIDFDKGVAYIGENLYAKPMTWVPPLDFI